MSTQFKVLDDPVYTDGNYIEVDERGGKFDINMWSQSEGGSDYMDICGVTPERLVELGIRLIQIALYSHKDAKAAHEAAIESLRKIAF